MRKQIGVCGVMIGLTISMSAAQASEVWVRQAHGRTTGAAVAEENNPVKAAPEGGATAAPTNTAANPTNPATCNQSNASSPACYSATQQNKAK